MSAAATQATLPFYEEALSYWTELSQECKHRLNAINSVISGHDMPENDGVSWRPEPDSIQMIRANYPSTDVKLSLAFEQWGPKICGSVRGYEEDDRRFYPEEFEFALGEDPDQGVVAITGEGRSLRPREFATYVAQYFRRSFPGLSLP